MSVATFLLQGGVSAAGCLSFGRHGCHFNVAVAVLLVIAAVRLGLRLGLRVGAGLAAADVVLAGAVLDGLQLLEGSWGLY